MVLNQLNMSMQEGNLYGLLGPNGTRESTTLHILMNIS